MGLDSAVQALLGTLLADSRAAFRASAKQSVTWEAAATAVCQGHRPLQQAAASVAGHPTE